MTAAVIFALVLAIVGWNIFVQFGVTSQVDVVSRLSPAQVHAAFRECFIGRLHDITTNGDTIQVRPRFKPKGYAALFLGVHFITTFAAVLMLRERWWHMLIGAAGPWAGTRSAVLATSPPTTCLRWVRVVRWRSGRSEGAPPGRSRQLAGHR
jgi:hypothetical protein